MKTLHLHNNINNINNNNHVIVKSDDIGLAPTIKPIEEKTDSHLQKPKDRMFDTEKGRPKIGGEKMKHLKRGTSVINKFQGLVVYSTMNNIMHVTES